MQKKEFEQRIHELLPVVSDAALANFVELSEEPEVEEDMGQSTFFDSFYVDLALVKRDYGEEIASTLFNFGEHYPFNPFELRGAARLMAGGQPIEEIAELMREHGYEYPYCEYTPEEEAESEALLWLFKTRKEKLLGTILSDPSSQGFEQEMG